MALVLASLDFSLVVFPKKGVSDPVKMKKISRFGSADTAKKFRTRPKLL